MAGQSSGDGLVRWLVGGLVAGGIVLGLLVGAYEIGYHRGHGKAKPAAQPAAPSTTTAKPQTGGLAARGKTLFAADGCAGCHSLTGAAGVGPTLKGLAGGSVKLADGSSVTADDAYLARSITDPDAQIVQGYKAGVMAAAVASFHLGAKPQDVDALVAYLRAAK